MKNWQPAKKRLCAECGEWYWNAGAHAERCFGRPLEENPAYGPGNPDWEHDRAREDAE